MSLHITVVIQMRPLVALLVAIATSAAVGVPTFAAIVPAGGARSSCYCPQVSFLPCKAR